jgi:hypothetical protein
MLRAMSPGCLWFQLERPEGLPDVDGDRSRMLRQLRLGTGLSALTAEENDALLLSLALTLERAHYHESRFEQIIALLDRRRRETGAFLTFDLFSQYALFEASAALGALRLGVDEVVFITARLRGIDPAEIQERWNVNDVITAGFDKRPEFDVSEVRALRSRRNWYDTLNEYRNVLLHRGWRGPFAAYVPLHSPLPESTDPKQNVMLVPDRASLSGRTRAHQWKYKQAGRLETVVRDAVRGFDDLIDDVAMNSWGGAVPAAGEMPREKTANIIVSYARPALLLLGDDVLVPVFTSRALAEKFSGYPLNRRSRELDLIEIHPTAMIRQEPAFTFGIPGLGEALADHPRTGDLVVLVDPLGIAPSVATARNTSNRVAIAELLAKREIEPLSIPQASIGTDRVFVWRPKPTSKKTPPESSAARRTKRSARKRTT